VNSTTNKIYAPHQSGAVAVIDEATLCISMVTAEQTPHFVTMDSAASQIYILNGGTSIFSYPPGTTVAVIDGATNSTTTLNVGEAPSAQR
jgi:DNA-binding beta-propeller fold protein YncE